MKNCRKVISLVLALIMLLSAVSVGLTASAKNKKDLYTTKAALSGKMNAADSYELTNEQYATIILDFADKTLGEANIPLITIPITDGFKIQIDATSINGLNGTFKDLGEKIGGFKSFLGDIGDLDFSMFKDSTARDDDTSSSDVAFISALVSFLSTKVNYEAVGKLVRKGLGTGSGQLNPGSIVNGFIPSDIKDLTSDIVGFLKKTLFGDANASFDANVATLVADTINSMEMEMLDGYTFEATDSIYTTIDKLVRVLTKWAVKNLQADTWHFKDMILSNMPTFEEDYPFVDLDGLTEITWDWQTDGMGTKFIAGTPSTYIIYHVNNLIGHVVDKVIPTFKDFKGGWTKDNSTSSLSTLNSNIAKAAQFADIKLNNGGTFTDAEADALANPTKSYAMVLADAMLKMFFPSLKVEKADIQQGNIAVLAVQALNEFFCYYMPEKTLTSANWSGIQDLYTYNASGTVLNRTYYTEARCQKIYKSMAALVLQKFAGAYLPTDKINFTTITNLESTTNIDTVLKDLGKYFLNYVCKAGDLNYGALGTVGSSETIYVAADRIIFSLNTSGAYIEGCTNGGRNTSGIIPEGFLPDIIKSSGHTHCTTKDVIDHLFSCIENLSVGDLLKILVPNSSNTEMTTALIPTLGCYEVIRILNVFFPGTWTSKTGSLDALINNNNLGNILEAILKNLNMNYHIFPALKLVCTMMGLSTAQTRGEADVSLAKLAYVGGQAVYTDISPLIETSGTSIPSSTYYIKVANTSKGIPGGYHNQAYEERMWVPYKLQVTSITCENDGGVSVSGVGSNTEIESNASLGFAVSGTASSTNKVLSFLIKYKMYYEDGARKGIEQQARLYAFLGTQSYTSISSATVTAKVPSTIYGSPSMFNNTIGYAITSNASATNSGSCEDTVFPSALTAKGLTFSASDVGTPTSTAGDQYKPFSVSVPGTVDLDTLYGTYTITYKLKTKDTAVEGSDYGSNTEKTINWVMFDDGGLPSLVSKYESMALQSFDYDNTTLWNAFQTELAKATAMIDKPSAYGTTVAALTTAFANEKEALTAAYEALAESSTADYTESLKARLVEYADGDEQNNIRAKYTMWDYTPVSYARYSSSLSTVRSYYNNKELSSVKVTEALRYNQEMALLLFTSTATENSKAKALVNLQTVKAAYTDTSTYSVSNYTLESLTALQDALAQADKVIGGKGLDGKSEPKTSDYADARNDILKSLNQLVDQPLDVIELYNAIVAAEASYKTEVSAYDEEDTRKDNMQFTDDSWNRFIAALESAYNAINNPQDVIEEAGSIASANALLISKYKQEITDAIANLEANPYVSRLVPKDAYADSFDTFNYGDKVMVGPQQIDIGNYIVVPYNCRPSATNLKKYFGFSKNVSRYTYEDEEDDDGNVTRVWKTYGGSDCTMKAYTDSTASKAASTTSGLVTGNIIRVTAPTGNYIDYTVIVAGNVNGIKTAAANMTGASMQATIDALKQYLPNIVNNVGVADMTPAYIMACDLNRDGRVDITDLVLLSRWEASATNCPVSIL